MKTEVIVEQPIFNLETSDWDGSGELKVYAADLKKAKVGDTFVPYADTNCGRAVDTEMIEVVYKSDNGVAVLYRHYGTTDSPNPVDWEDEPKLIWVELH